MDEENNNQESSVKKIAKDAKKKAGQEIKKAIIKHLPAIASAIGYALLIILAFCLIYLLTYKIISFFVSIVNFFSPSQSATDSINASVSTSTGANAINQTASIIYIDEDTGEYKLQDDFAKKLLEYIDEQGVDAKAAKYITDDLEDMLDKYIKAEVQTMFPKTGLAGNDIDGLITIQRASTDRNYKNIKI